MLIFVIYVLFRWTINLALQTANEVFKSSSPFDAADLAEVEIGQTFIAFNIPWWNVLCMMPYAECFCC